MSKIILKTDYENGKVLQAEELNVNNNVIMSGVNDNFNRINSLGSTKADIVDVNNKLANKADISTVNTQISAINSAKADKIDLATKANISDLDAKANQSYVDSQLTLKANQSYVDGQLASKVDIDTYNSDINLKADKSDIGDLDDLKTESKDSLVDAINSINIEAKSIATVDSVGVVKPDGTTITIDQDGTIHSLGGGGGIGTGDYNDLANKPKINDVELKDNVSLSDLGLMSAKDVNSNLAAKADVDSVYTKSYINTNVISPLGDKANKSDVDAALELKADVTNTYDKSTVDDLINGVNSGIDSKLLLKANVSDVYNKADVNNLVGGKADNLRFEDDQLQLTSGGIPIGNSVTLALTGNEVVISNEQPQNDDWKLWVNSDNVQNLGSEVVNSLSGNEIDKAPSVQVVKNKFNELTTYSTEEQVIGTWINGKPLYRKVIIGTSTIVDQNNEIYHNIENIDEIMCSSESYIRIADNFFQLNRPNNGATNIDKTTIQSNLNKQAIVLYVGSYLQTSGYNYSIVLKYTKTTDTATVATISEEV